LRQAAYIFDMVPAGIICFLPWSKMFEATHLKLIWIGKQFWRVGR